MVFHLLQYSQLSFCLSSDLHPTVEIHLALILYFFIYLFIVRLLVHGSGLLSDKISVALTFI